MAHGKCAPERTSKASRKHSAIDFEMKIRMMCEYEAGRSSCGIACEHLGTPS
jgi:hypothetical protein